MKKLIFFFSLLGILTACSNDDNVNQNPNLLDVNVNYFVDMNLPQFNALNFPSNPVYIGNQGNGGIYVMNTGPNQFVAWDAADPNHPFTNECPTMELDGIQVTCACEGNTYELFTGNFMESENELQYTLWAYRVTVNGNNTLQITN
ncbi:membrane lipoprotein lipid attachment site-containing protein [Mesonia sp. K7]|uniref:membrane lipoprotein lipid attachment site-containing protein n=1 Tax=Mesonia sp. K7 TaxID=2218606 RepID=UPI000DAA7BA6|nr:membrane lipoprotein lipid attachment site-containing protein [Mesonia sp. K7]PZD78939.1 hypothetical protein DNG35_02740 [Mesonia sp. K7]